MNEDVQGSYDRVAEQYAGHLRDELEKKPFDRKTLDWLDDFKIASTLRQYRVTGIST